MGTRHLTIVRSKGKTKVAQYGQWDGYLAGQGRTIQKFLKNADIKQFKREVDKLKEFTNEEIDNIYKEAGHKGNSDWITSEVANKVKEKYPELSRDTGAEVLELIYQGKVKKLTLNESFKEDTLFCEFCYELDLDKETITVNDKEYTFEQWKVKRLR